MKDNNKLVLSIVTVLLLGLLVFGATFAYWRWVSENNTIVRFSVAGGEMTIDGGGDINSVKVLAPAVCTNSKYAIQRKIKVTATNQSNKDMTQILKLKVNELTASHGTLNTDNKSAIEWMLVRTDLNQYNTNTWLQTTDKCIGTVNTDQALLKTNGTILNKGNFSNINTNDEIVLYNGDKVSTNQETDNYFELYIWINPAYEGLVSTGSTIYDALQDLTLKLSLQGVLTNDPEA